MLCESCFVLLMLYLIIALPIILIISLTGGYFFRQMREKGRVTRGLNMVLFSVRMVRDAALQKDGQEQKKKKKCSA